MLANLTPAALSQLRTDQWTGPIAGALHRDLSHYQHVPGITFDLDQRLRLIKDYVRVNNAVRDAGLTVETRIDVDQAEAWFAATKGGSKAPLPLKVFGIRTLKAPGWMTIVSQPRVIVAATSRAAAFRAIKAHHSRLGETEMREHSSVTSNEAEVAIAMAEPGVVFIEADSYSSAPVGPKFMPLRDAEGY